MSISNLNTLSNKVSLGLDAVNNTSDPDKPVSTATQAALNEKQDALVSGTNIKTINGSTILGGGDLVVAGGSSSSATNYIHNGSFAVWQLGTSWAACPHYQLLADRWVWGQSAGSAVWTVSRDVDVPPGNDVNYSLKVEVTTPDGSLDTLDETHIRHCIEGYDMRTLKGQSCVLNFWVKSSVVGTYCIALVGSLEGTGVTRVYEYPIAVANTWEEKSILIAFDYASDTNWNYTFGQGLKIRWSLRCGSTFQTTTGSWQSGNFVGTSSQVNFAATAGNIFKLAKAQLVIGSSAPAFHSKPYVDELATCKRYLQVLGCEVAGLNACYGFASTTTSCNFDYPLSTEMRVAPVTSARGTIGTDYDATSIAGTQVNFTSITSYSRSKNTAKWTTDKTAGFVGGNAYLLRLITTSGKLVFNSEWANIN